MNPTNTQLQFDASQVAPATGVGEPIPSGDYTVQMIEGDIRPTSKAKRGEAKNDTAIAGKFEVIDGEHKGRLIFHNFNYTNGNEEAQRIGRSELSALCHAAGVLDLRDLQQLYKRPFSAKVGIEAADGTYAAKNKILRFARADGQFAMAYMAPVAGAAAAPAAAYTPPAATPEAPTPAAPVAPPAPVAAAPVLVIDQAKIAATGPGVTVDTFRAQGWTDDHLVAGGYASWQQPAPVVPAAPPVPTAPAVPTPPPVAAPPAPVAAAPVPPSAGGVRADGTPKRHPWEAGYDPALDS